VAGTQRMTCVVPRASELDACGWYAMGADGIGISKDGGASFESYLKFTDVTESVQCADTAATASICAQLSRDWQYEIFHIGFGSGGANGGSGGASGGIRAPSGSGGAPNTGSGGTNGVNGAVGQAPHARAGGGCSLQRAPRGDRVAIVFVFGCALLLRRRRAP
jgi:hypothetical protein